MINVTDKFKQAMKEPVKMVTASLVLDDNTVITGQDKLIKITIDSSGHLFGTATSVINIELFGTNYNLVDHTFSVVAKTLIDAVNDTWEEANLGLFYVEESTADFEKKTTRIKGYDLMGKLAKTPYNSGTIQFPCAVKELINQLAGRFDFTVDTNLDNLPNITYQIPEDLYAKISNCTYRDILGEIAGATATIAVFNGKTLSFRDSKKKPDEDEIWTYDNLKTLKYKPKYGPVNSLVLARTPQEDNVAVADNTSVANNGRTEVKLANNEILDDDRRKLITPIFNSVKDFSHHPFEAETTGLGWYKPGDLVLAQASGKLINGRTIGWLSQNKPEGKNLIKFNRNFVTNGVSVKTDANGRITEAKGIMTAGWTVISDFYDNVLFPAGTYTLSVDRPLNHTITASANYTSAPWYLSANLNAGQTKVTFTADRPFRTFRVSLSDVVGTNIDLGAFTPKLSLGDTPTDEPYIGNDVSAGYRNMFDEFSELPVNKNGLSLINQDGTLKLSGTPDSDWVQLVSRDITSILMDTGRYTIAQYNNPNTKFYVEISARKKDGSGFDVIGNKTARIHNFTADFTKYDQYKMVILCGKKDDTTPLPLYGNFALYYGTFNENNLPEYTPYLTPLTSPRPQLPQVIKELSGQNIKILGKNLLKITNNVTANQIRIATTVNQDGSITIQGENKNFWGMNFTDDSACPIIEKGTKVTLSIDRPLPYKLILSCWANLGDKSFQFSPVTIDAGRTSATGVTKYTAFSGHLVISLLKIGKQINETFKVQLEYGDTATPFTPYEFSEFTMPSGLNIYKLTDDIYDEVKLENGVAKLIKRVGKLELTGEEEKITHCFTTPAGTIGFKYKNPTEEKIFVQQNSVANIICSHFNAINEDAVYTTRENKTGVAIYGGYNNFPKYTNTIAFWFKITDQAYMKITDVVSFKNWLKAEKAKGTPVTVYYEMKEPQITELGRTNLNQVYVTDTHLELGNGIKETIKGIAPTATQTDYARAGGITKTIYNTEIKVDKQKQEIESVVSKQTQVDQKLNEEFTKVTQNIKDVVTTIQTTGGGNLIKNSVGYAKNQDGTLVEWSKNSVGEVKSYTSPESRSYGAISGNAIELKKGASITQRLNVASSGKIPYSLSFRAKKGAIGTATVKLSNTIDSFVITIPENKEIIWQNFDLTKIDPSMNNLDVTVSTSNNCEQFLITDLMVNMGDQVVPWVQANGEILNTQVAVNDQGMMVSSSVYSGDYVQITPLGMSGHSNVTGTDEEVFKLNRDVTETSKLSARKEINMDPIKIVPVKDGERPGWYFVG
nr:MAG TPA: Minor structural protein putative tail fiber [Caudoviricetes sp.]